MWSTGRSPSDYSSDWRVFYSKERKIKNLKKTSECEKPTSAPLIVPVDKITLLPLLYHVRGARQTQGGKNQRKCKNKILHPGLPRTTRSQPESIRMFHVLRFFFCVFFRFFSTGRYSYFLGFFFVFKIGFEICVKTSSQNSCEIWITCLDPGLG